MRMVILGGAGFIGSYLVEALLAKGHSVVCVDNFITGNRENVAGLLNTSSFTLVEADVSDGVEVSGHVDFVFHLASPASPTDFDGLSIEIMKAGSLATFHALELARRKGAGFLFASTSEVYGDPSVSPQPESYWGNVNPIGPRAPYDEAKRFGEAATMAYHRRYGLDTRIARIFNTYGPRMRPTDGRVVPNFVSQALRGEDLTIYGDGSQTRSFCYVSDLVEGLVRLMQARDHTPVNLGAQDEFTILELAKVILRETGSKSKMVFRPLPKDDPKQRCPDITKAKAVLGWEPVVKLQEGIRRTIAWFADQQLLPR
jgi:dTDP-glucose 4,6-dehydratase